MDARDIAKGLRRPRRPNRPKSQERLKGVFRPVNGDTHALFN